MPWPPGRGGCPVCPRALPEWAIFHSCLSDKVGREAPIVKADENGVWKSAMWVPG